MKKSFVIHTDSLSILDDLTDEQAGQLFKAIKSYHEGEDSDLDTIIRIAFNPFRNQFQRDQEKYLNRVEVNRANGSKGGKKKVANASKRKPKVAILADSDSDSVSDNDSKSVSNSKSDKDKNNIKGLVFAFDSDSFLHTWNLWLNYRREQKKTIKGLTAAQGQMNKLARLSGGSEQTAQKIVMQSIENNWTGLFELKNNNNERGTNGHYTPQQQANNRSIVENLIKKRKNR